MTGIKPQILRLVLKRSQRTMLCVRILAALLVTLWIYLSDRSPETPIATSLASILDEVEAGARAEKEETVEADVLKAVEVRVPHSDVEYTSSSG